MRDLGYKHRLSRFKYIEYYMKWKGTFEVNQRGKDKEFLKYERTYYLNNEIKLKEYERVLYEEKLCRKARKESEFGMK